MPISVKKIITVSMETVQKTTNRFSSTSTSQEWFLFPTGASSSLSTASTSLEAAASTSSDKNLSVEPAPRKGSWDFTVEEQQEDIKEASELESMIQCTSTFF